MSKGNMLLEAFALEI